MSILRGDKGQELQEIEKGKNGKLTTYVIKIGWWQLMKYVSVLTTCKVEITCCKLTNNSIHEYVTKNIIPVTKFLRYN